MKKYSCGFIFDLQKQRVLLIKKKPNSPTPNLWNGHGGKIEENESALDCIIRETQEELGISIKTWNEFCELRGDNWTVHFFRTFTNKISLAKQMEDELIEIFNLKLIPKVVTNVNWLLQIALNIDNDRADKLIITEINEENRSETEISVNKPVTKYIKAEQFELPLNN